MDIELILYLYIVLGYVLGSIPCGLVLCRVGGYGDIRKIGSGNIGATNVLRTGNKPLALITLVCDIGKGAAAVFITQYFTGNELLVLGAGGAAVIGHMYPVWLKFSGGKGVATTLGTILAISPVLGATMCGIWLLIAFTLRISSLSALTAFALSPALAYVWLENENLAFFSGIIALLVFWRHKENIQRLLKGEEPKIGSKKKGQKTNKKT
ncbi:MAG: glycerol-3-phosphate 1-O-acyltransferase PlsY [Pseudomonadota bacterium]